MIRKYPSLYLLCFVVTGILISDLTHLPVSIFLLGCLAGFLGGVISLSRGNAPQSMAFFGLSFLFFSAFHFGIGYYEVGPYHVSRILQDGQEYHLFGRVSDWPRIKADRTEVKLDLDSIAAERTQAVRGAVLLKISDTTTALQRGDRLEFSGRVYTVKGSDLPGRLDYRRYLRLKGVSGLVYLPTLLDVRIDRGSRLGVYRLVDRLRTSMRDSFYRNLSPESAALAAGFLIGETRDIPTDVYNWFRDTGTLHLLAVSGSNVALVVLSAMFLLRAFGISRGRLSGILLLVVVVFALLSYGEPSVVRASVMASLVIAANVLQRRYNLNNVIAATALIILLVEPTHLFNIGFQLSFVTAWGLIFFTPRLERLFGAHASRVWYRWVIWPILVSVVAQVCSTPLIALYFKRVPVISVVANLAIVPLVSVSVIGSIILLFSDLILPTLGLLVGSLLNQLLSLVVFLLQVLGGEAIPVLQAGVLPPVSVLLFYYVLVAAVWSLRSHRARRLAVISLLMAANLVLAARWAASLRQTDSVKVVIITVPGGTAALIFHSGAREGDLVLTGLTHKDYDLDDRIIDPLLAGYDIDKLNSLFVTCVDYDAIDDVLRLAQAYAVTAVYVPGGLQASVKEVIQNGTFDLDEDRIVVYGPTPARHQGWGYYPSRLGVLLEMERTGLLFSDRIGPEHANFACRYDGPSLLVSGYLTAGVAFRVEGSSETAQGTGCVVSRFSHGQIVPSAVYDLRASGGAILSIPVSRSKALRVTPLS